MVEIKLTQTKNWSNNSVLFTITRLRTSSDRQSDDSMSEEIEEKVKEGKKDSLQRDNNFWEVNLNNLVFLFMWTLTLIIKYSDVLLICYINPTTIFYILKKKPAFFDEINKINYSTEFGWKYINHKLVTLIF